MEYKSLLENSKDLDKTLNLILSEISHSFKPDLFFIFLDSTLDTFILKKSLGIPQDKALDIILEILKKESSKKMLRIGNNLQENSNRNFTTISLRISRIILELHQIFTKTLKNSQISWNCLEILIENTNYSSLKQGAGVLDCIIQFIYSILDGNSRETLSEHEITQFRIGAMKILDKVLDKKVGKVLLDLEIFTKIIQKLQDTCLEKEEVNSSFSVLKSFIRNSSQENLEYIWEILENSKIFSNFKKENVYVLMEFSKSLKKSQVLIENTSQEKKEASSRLVHVANQSNTSTQTIEGSWWLKIMGWVLPLLNDPDEDVRSAGLDLLSQISESAFRNLPSKLVFTLQSIGIGMLSDVKDSVRAAACGFLGVLITFDCVQRDLLFFSDLIAKIPRITMEDDSLVVKVRSSWALANIGAAFLEIKEKHEEFSIPDGYLRKCVEAALFASKEKEKCRSNGVRALGNIFHVLPKEWVKSEVEGLVKDIVEVLIKSVKSGPVKTRWNACHAITNILKSCNFPLRRASFTESLLKSLQEAMISSKNFKVRIAATTALGTVKASWFGQDSKLQSTCINSMLTNLDLAMTATDDLVGSDFGEFRYQQQLKEQIIATQTHFKHLKLNHVEE